MILDNDVVFKIRKILNEVGNAVEAGRVDIDDDMELIESGVIDSVGIVALIAGIETEFGITLGESQVLSLDFTTISRLASSLKPILEKHQK
jgi:acyl carrier protein